MNKKGFTLVEALLVIAIIGVLLLTLIPSVITIINKNKEKTCISTRDSIISAAKMFAAENKYDYGFECDKTISITFKELLGYGNISKTPEQFEDDDVVNITYNCDTKEFVIDFDMNCN